MWIYGGLLIRGERGGEGRKKRGEEGRKEGKGKGKGGRREGGLAPRS